MDTGSNPFLKRYGKLNYDTSRLADGHLRVKRSLDQNLYFTFNSHGQ